MSTDQPLSQLELEAVEVIAAARGLADKLEQMLVTVLQSRMEESTPTPVSAPVQLPEVGFKIHPSVLQLADPKAVISWDRTDEGILELRSYAFMHITGKSNGNVGFKYLTARMPKTNYQKHMDPKVYETLEPGKVYIIHTTKQKGRNFWDCAIPLKMTDSDIMARAKLLSRFYGELMEQGRI